MTVKDLSVCLSKAHGMSMLPLIEYLIMPYICSNEVGKLGGSIMEKGNVHGPASRYKS